MTAAISDTFSLPADLRAWQRHALSTYLRQSPRDFAAVATPGAGKTRFALVLAGHLMRTREVQRLTIVTPTEHLKKQWADAAHAHGLHLDPTFTNAAGRSGRDYDGVVVTYAQVAMAPLLHRARTEAKRSLVVLDEVHHAGDALSWGDAVREAFTPAVRRLTMTGTPFRSDDNPIPFVTYSADGEGAMRSVADTSYGYGDALRDGVVRPVIFLAYSGEMRWRTSAGAELAARLGEPMTSDVMAQAWRTALDPGGEWIPQVLRAADQRLTAKRREMPDAGGLVIASDQATARAYALLLRRISDEPPVVVLSDDPTSSRKIGEFRRGNERWMVAVRMVSEGVDIPRLAVGIYATSTQTPLFFAQAIGRFVRARARGETATVFLPSVPSLLSLAAEMESERDHVLGRPVDGLDDCAFDERALADALRARDGEDLEDGPGFQALEASASFDRALYDGNEFGTYAAVGSEEEQDFLGLPGLLEPDQVAALLRQRQAQQAKRGLRRGAQGEHEPESEHQPDVEVPAYERAAALRKQLSALVAAHAARSGRPHAEIHAELRRRCGGPPTAQATVEQLAARITALSRP
jgi:superfamily II DNA or RNA helicase